MRTLTLAIYNIKRLLRHKTLRTILAALPVAVALVRIIFVNSAFAQGAARICPILCVGLIAAVLYAQWIADIASGLIDGLRSSQISHRTLATSRAISGVSIFALQMFLFAAIIAMRF
ncbi:MAG: hypothetical protein GX139_11950 [Armatimonadetes bacterium]|jgi:hypothetical protein|nr:hypothetical protein [Armatimonadota bacterium]